MEETGREELTLEDYAKYPFIRQASQYVERLGLKLEDFSDLGLKPVTRAVERIKNSTKPLKDVSAPPIPSGEELNELLSFPLALFLVKAVGDEYFMRRLALYEARVARARLENEEKWKIIRIVRENFGWRLLEADGGRLPFKLSFIDYLRNASRFHEEEWKLVNQQLLDGYVYLSKGKVIRLIEEEIKRHIEERLSKVPEVEVPENLKPLVEELKAYLRSVKQIAPYEELGKVKLEAFPPCMANLYFDISSGKDVPHIGRFTLTAFLINLGMPLEEIVKLYTSITDFDERLTKYQVEHIAGLVGGKTRYKPLSCGKMKTHGLCPGGETLCDRVRSPLAYYKLKMKLLKKPVKEKVES